MVSILKKLSSVAKNQASKIVVAGQTVLAAATGKVIVSKTSNVGTTYSIQSAKVQANTSSPTANAILGTVANHPFVAAAVITGVAKAPSLVAGIKNAAPSIAQAVPSGIRSLSLSGATKTAALVGGGALAGSLLFGSGGGPQESAQNQATAQTQGGAEQWSRQDADQNTFTDNQQWDNSIRTTRISGSPGAFVDTSGPYSSPSTTPSQGLYSGQEAGFDQRAGLDQQSAQESGAGISPLILVAGGVLAYMLLKD